jgi:hypothetical protein
MSCVNFDVSSNKMGYIWSEISGNYADSLASTKDPKTLSIAADVLTAETTYTFQVVGYMVDDPSINNTATVEVVVGLQKIVALIAGGSFRQFGIGTTFTLDASSSYDPDASSGNLKYFWSCSADTSTADCSGLSISSKSSSTLTVAKNKLTTGEYTFAMNLVKGTRNDTATVTIEITAGTPPVITISKPTKAKYNIDDEFLSVASTVSSSLSYSTSWSFVTSDVKKPFFYNGAAASSLKNQLTAVLGLYGFTRGDTYKFKLTATDSAGYSSYSTISITMNMPPSGGSLEVSPMSGFALETSFTFTAVQWTEDDLPVTYIFGTTAVNTDGSLDTSFLSPFGDERTDASYTDVTLSQGSNSSNFTVGAYTSVIDYYGATSSDHISIQVTTKTYTTEQLTNITETKAEQAISSKNGENSRQVLSASGRNLKGNKKGTSLSRSRRRQLLGTGNRQGSEAALRASNLVNLWATYEITTITQSDVASLLNVLTGILNIPDEVTYDVASGAHNFLHTVDVIYICI